jgi:hypothetical protein
MFVPSKSSTRRLRRLLILPVAAALLVPTATGPAAASDRGGAHPGPRSHGYVIEGKKVFPEGIAADRRYVYVTSLADGTVYRGPVGGTSLKPFLKGGKDGRTAGLGMLVTGNRLLIAGGTTGLFFVYNSRTKALVARFTVPDAKKLTLLNDVTVTPRGDAYITDSHRPVIYKIPAAQIRTPSRVTRTLKVAVRLPAATWGKGFNTNGIVATPDGRSLLTVFMNSGALYRLDLRTKKTHQVKLDRPLLNGDGLLLRGRTLYAVRNFDNLIVTLRLSSRYTSARTVAERTYPGADVPTTLAYSRGRLLTPNSQFDTLFGGAPLTSKTFTVSSIPLR